MYVNYLGVALPHEHMTWFAKTVTDKSIPPSEIKAPAKGTPIARKELIENVNKMLSRNGGDAQNLLKMLML